MEGIATAYAQLWSVVKLPAVGRLSVILVACRLAFLCAESAASLKLIEKGVPKVRCRASLHELVLIYMLTTYMPISVLMLWGQGFGTRTQTAPHVLVPCHTLWCFAMQSPERLCSAALPPSVLNAS